MHVTVEADEDDEDPFSEQQVRIPDRPVEYKQSSVSSNPFIAHVYENATPHRYRPDLDYRAAFLADFLSFPTIFEEDEDEAPVAHLRASPSHDSLLAVDSYPWEFEQVCTFKPPVDEPVLIPLQYSTLADAAALPNVDSRDNTLSMVSLGGLGNGSRY